MRKTKGMWALVLVWACVAIGSSPVVQAQTPERVLLTVLHTNDTHSCVMPINKNYADTMQADKGGFLRRAVFVAQEREKDTDLLLFDCGDFSQGSPYYSLFKGEVEVELMNYMRYDACTIGNHEFDFGLENMAHLFRKATFPVVCCNYGFSGTVLEGCVKPYVVLERKGVRVGVLGVAPAMDGLVAHANYEGVTYEDPVTAAGRVVEILRGEEKCDVVICLSHLGWNLPGMSDEEFIRATRGIDVVLGGHSHTYLTEPEFVENADGCTVVYNQVGKNGQFVGRMEIGLKKRSGQAKP